MHLTVGELRAQAQVVLDQVDLLGVRANEVHATGPDASLGANPAEAVGTLDVTNELGVQGRQRKEFVDCMSRYTVSAKSEDGGGDAAWRVSVTVVGTWQARSHPSFSEDELRAFSLVIGSITLHPYAREVVQSTVTRLGFPPYTLQMLQPLSAGADGDLVKIEENE